MSSHKRVSVLERDRETACAMAQRFSRLVTSRSEDAHAWHALGAALLALGDRSGARAAFVNALRLDGTRIHSRRALGNLLFDCGQYDEALLCFARCEVEVSGTPAPAATPAGAVPSRAGSAAVAEASAHRGDASAAVPLRSASRKF